MQALARRGDMDARTRRRRVLLTMLGANIAYTNLVLNTSPANLVAYWPLNETSGTNADDKQTSTNADGTYTGTFTLGQPGIGDGNTSVLFDGLTARVNLTDALAALNGAGKFNGAAGTISGFAKVSAVGVWTDTTTDYMAEFGADANNRVQLDKSANNTIQLAYRAGGTLTQIQATVSALTFFHFAITWNKAADQVMAFINGAQAGTTQTGLGVWAGVLAATFTGIGDFRSTSSSAPWNGWLAHIAMWNIALTPSQIATLAPASFLV